MSEKKELPPDRYYTPQVQSSVSHKLPSIYQPTPKPESVIVHEKTRFISVLYLSGSKR
ncbi:hypothetical protein CU097_011847 [Rhizopus azygosporus]|uniref:Uncharacterized protein n=1 Tax=Rhizopus azygosporus TaxID=86630 RepID=A0A367JVA9_RHIAZ|nr:hypothetical protein CU097_011847 [Rhizopus azygosporus]